MKKKILFYNLTFHPANSGYANAFKNLISALSDKCNDLNIHIVTPEPLKKSEEISLKNVQITRIKGLSNIGRWQVIFNSIIYLYKFKKLLKKEQYDEIFIETFQDAIFLTLLPKKYYNKLLIRVHSTFETEYNIFFPKKIYKLNTFLLKRFVFKKLKYLSSTNSYHIEFVKKYFLDEDLYKISKKDFFVLPNTMSLENINVKDNSIINEKLKFLMLGRLDKEGYLQKGQNDLINALILLKPQLKGKINFTIIGDGEYRNKLIQKADANDLDFIHFIDKLSHQETLERMISNDVIVLPSRYEGMSMFAMEALATKNVVLFSNTGGLKDMVKDNGFLFDPQNVEELSQVIIKVLNLDKDSISQMKENSLQLFKYKFSEESVVDKFVNILNIINADNK